MQKEGRKRRKRGQLDKRDKKGVGNRQQPGVRILGNCLPSFLFFYFLFRFCAGDGLGGDALSLLPMLTPRVPSSFPHRPFCCALIRAALSSLQLGVGKQHCNQQQHNSQTATSTAAFEWATAGLETPSLHTEDDSQKQKPALLTLTFPFPLHLPSLSGLGQNSVHVDEEE